MTTRRLLLVAFVSLAVGVPACTGGGDGSPAPTSPATSESPLPTHDEKYVFVPGKFTYDFGGVTAALSWKGGAGTLKVTNGGDADVGPPALYALDQANQRFDATVKGAAPVAAGDATSFEVTFPSTLAYADAGLIVLELGDQNYGAMSPLFHKAT